MTTPARRSDAQGPIQQWGIFVILLAFLGLVLAYSIVIPLGEAADEVSHFAYVEYLIEHKTLPKPEGIVLGEAHQAPLYYAVAALATAWAPRDGLVVLANPDFVLTNPDTPNLLLHPRNEGFPYQGTVLAWHLVRLVSVLCALVTVWATWQTARVFFPNDTFIPLAAASLVAFVPSFLSLSAAVNNDNLIIMLASLSFLVVAQINQRGLATRRTAILGVLLGLALLTKLNAFALWAFVGASYLLLFFQTRTGDLSLRTEPHLQRNAISNPPGENAAIDFTASRKPLFAMTETGGERAYHRTTIARHLVLCFGIAFAIALPYLVYNTLTHGDPLAWSLYLKVAPLRQTPLSLTDLLGLGEPVFTSFWGRFGGALQLRMPGLVYLGLGIVMLLALGGVVREIRRSGTYAKVGTIVLLTLILMPLLGAVYFRFIMADLGAGQARMLLPGILPLGLVLTVGWFALLKAHRNIALLTWSVGFFMLGIAALIFINSIYASPVIAASAEPNAQPIDFGKTIRVRSYRVEQVKIAPGGEIAVELDWQALAVPQENYWLSLQLVGAEGGAAGKDGVPTAGRTTTDWWQPGQTFRSRHTLPVPEDVTPGKYALTLGLHPYDRWEWLPVRGADSVALAEITVSTDP